MFKKTVYKYMIEQYTITGKKTVFPSFLEHLKDCKPVNVRCTKTLVFIVYSDGKYTVHFTLPIAYKSMIVK